MNRIIIKRFLLVVFIFSLAVPAFVRAQTGNHFGEINPLSYKIEYLDPLGVTFVDETGILFVPFGPYRPSVSPEVLPESYFGDYPLYFTEHTVHYTVTIKNEGPRTYRNLKVETFQEFLNEDGGLGEPMGEDNYYTWFVDKLGPEEEIVLTGEFFIPLFGTSGIDQTHLRISHETISTKNNGQVILEDFQAGLWCPTE